MDKITKQKDGKYIITKTTEEVVDLKQLEAELENLEKENSEIEQLEEELNSVPESIKPYIQLPVYRDDEIEKLKTKINLIKNG